MVKITPKKALDFTKAVIDAKKNGLNVEEEYFQNRLSLCTSCPFNSANTEDGGKPKSFVEFGVDLLRKAIKSESHCTACGCDILLKINDRSQICGKIEKGLEPEWQSLEVDVPSMPGTYLSQPEDQKAYFLKNEITTPVLIFKDADPKVIDFAFDVFYPKKYTFINATVSCGCTVPVITVEKEGHLKISVRVSTLGFEPQYYSRKAIYLHFENHVQKKLSFTTYLDIKVAGDGL